MDKQEQARLISEVARSLVDVAPEGERLDRAELEVVGYELFKKMPHDPAPVQTWDPPDGLGILMGRRSRGGGKLFIAPDRTLLFSPSAESVEQGLERFRAGERTEPKLAD